MLLFTVISFLSNLVTG